MTQDTLAQARRALDEAIRQLDINVSIARRDHPEGPVVDGKRLNIDALPHSQDILAGHVKDRIREALAAIDAALEGGGWLPIESAPKDGTHIIALLYRGATEDMDGRKHRAFTEVREIFYKPYSIFGMDLPWHAGDPMDSHDGVGADSHMGEAVPIGWLPRSALPLPPVGV